MKIKIVMSWISRKKKRTFFVPFILSEGIFFNICVLSQCIVYLCKITLEIDNEARISKEAEMKRKFNRNQKCITL